LPNRVVVGEILRPRGNRGEVLVKSQTDVPGRLQGLRRAQARLADGSDVPVEITEAWVHDGDWVFKFAGVDSITQAERFRGADVWIPSEERGTLPPGEFFESDLIGCVLVDAATGAELGRIEGWQACADRMQVGPPLMQSTIKGREVLIPFVPAICREIDLTARTIQVALPAGLLDL
jgi:16S rRNA processing protein RimM